MFLDEGEVRELGGRGKGADAGDVVVGGGKADVLVEAEELGGGVGGEGCHSFCYWVSCTRCGCWGFVFWQMYGVAWRGTGLLELCEGLSLCFSSAATSGVTIDPFNVFGLVIFGAWSSTY